MVSFLKPRKENYYKKVMYHMYTRASFGTNKQYSVHTPLLGHAQKTASALTNTAYSQYYNKQHMYGRTTRVFYAETEKILIRLV